MSILIATTAAIVLFAAAAGWRACRPLIHEGESDMCDNEVTDAELADRLESDVIDELRQVDGPVEGQEQE